MTDQLTADRFIVTDEMILRGLEFFERTTVSSQATETTYPEFVIDLLNFSLFGKAPWPAEEEEASKVSETE